MNKQNPLKSDSLRTFLRNQLLILTSFIVVGFAFILYYIYIDGLDIATRKNLNIIGQYYAQLHDEGSLNKTTLETGEFSIFIGQENLPPWLVSRFPQPTFENEQLFKSFLRLTDAERQRGLYPMLLMTAVPIEQGERQLFAVYHFKPIHRATFLEGAPPLLETILIVTLVVLLFLLIAIAWIAHHFNRRVLAPMEALADMAHNVDEQALELTHPILNDRSEIGQVAQALNQSMARIHTFHQREKTFLQNASHELRTPITVVGSALDIIERRLAMGKQDIEGPLKHIRQASFTMKETTEALLWLSREPHTDGPTTAIKTEQYPPSPVDLQQILRELVTQLNYLIEGRDIDVNITIQTQQIQLYDPALVRIVFANLIRNAFEHTFDGRVDIHADEVGIEIRDTGIGLNNQTNPIKRGESGRDSFGLGLDIVSRIADKKGWQLSLQNNSNGGCTAILVWSTESTPRR